MTRTRRTTRWQAGPPQRARGRKALESLDRVDGVERECRRRGGATREHERVEDQKEEDLADQEDPEQTGRDPDVEVGDERDHNDHEYREPRPLDVAQPAQPRRLPDLAQLELEKVSKPACQRR